MNSWLITLLNKAGTKTVGSNTLTSQVIQAVWIAIAERMDGVQITELCECHLITLGGVYIVFILLSFMDK